MAVELVRNILIADATVHSLVDVRVSPVLREQDEPMPCVVLNRISVVPQNHLHGRPSLDQNRIQLDAYAETYADVRALAEACRDALELADVVLDNEIDNFEPDVDEYRITQDYLIWTERA